MQQSDLSPQMTFAEAFELWLSKQLIEEEGLYTNARYISPRTEKDLRQYARAAGRFFTTLRLDEIAVGNLKGYQRARALNLVRIRGESGPVDTHPWEQQAGANLIKKEVGTVVRVMRAAGAWTPAHEENFEPLQVVNADVQRALLPDEQHRWLRAAGSRENWRLVYWWSIAALQTTAATNEMRALRLGDVFLDQGIMQIRSEGAKNKVRIRTIPLTSPEVVWALGGLIERARQLGAKGPHHYLFPFHIAADRYDPLRPMTVWGMRKPWDAVKAAAGIDWLRPYDLRHSAITRMAEAGVPIQMIMSFAGHISPFMQAHYTAISMQAKRRWAAVAWAGAEMPFTPGPAPVPAWTPPPVEEASPVRTRAQAEQAEPKRLKQAYG